MWKETIVSQFEVAYYPRSCLKELRETAKNLSQNI
jgi:hypothetical protein